MRSGRGHRQRATLRLGMAKRFRARQGFPGKNSWRSRPSDEVSSGGSAGCVRVRLFCPKVPATARDSPYGDVAPASLPEVGAPAREDARSETRLRRRYQRGEPNKSDLGTPA
jgi:hypothetical protein